MGIGLASVLSWGEEYPTRPIQIVVAYAPGSTDVYTRIFTDKMPEFLGQPMSFVYKPGAGGVIGGSFAAHSKPDGYTLFASSKGPVIFGPLTKENVDYTLDPLTIVTGATQDNIDIMNWDDYTKYSFVFKAAYHFSKSLTVSAGYAYERFKYNDVQLDDYQFVNPPGGPVTGSSGAYLTGYQKDQSYRANLVFGGVTYTF